jgi:hypothetical protein
MPRLELIFLHSANGGGCKAPRAVQRTKVPIAAQLAHGITPARGPYVVAPVLSGAFFLTLIFSQSRRPILKIPIASATPE